MGFQKRSHAGRIRWFHGIGCLETSPRVRAQPIALDAVADGEEIDEPDGVVEAEGCLGDGECGRDLLIGRQVGDPLGDGDAEETVGEDVDGLRGHPLQDPKPALDPDLLPSQDPGDGVRSQAIGPSDVGEDGELFSEGGLAGGVVAPQALELRLNLCPGLDDDPRLRLAPFPQVEVAPEAVDQDEAITLFDDHEGMVRIEVRCGCRVSGDLERDRG